jgi:NADPH:quinone reductase-like Zn-dependent oxidoreductase
MYLAQALGAEIYATVSTEQKVAFLVEHFDIPRRRIFNSRTDTFATDIMRETNGRGVDLVLNSLSGDLLHATWQCLAPFGKMVEIGKKDLMDSGKLDMSPFLENRSFACVDVAPLITQMPHALQRLVSLSEQGTALVRTDASTDCSK